MSDNTDNVELNTWNDFDINENLLRGIYCYGFEAPSEIQKKTFNHIVSGKDIIAQSQSGSGKTGAFAIGALQLVDTKISSIQVIVMAPTRELAKQISTVITGIGSMMEGLRIKSIYGGTSIQNDALEIKQNVPHIVVGCSGRIYDMIKRKYLNVSKIRLIVLDEADEMLSKGFKEQIYNIFQFFNESAQVALFSATLSPEILEITEKFMRDPIKITIKAEDLTLECIQQYFLAIVDDHAKYDMLKTLFSIISVSQTIIYCNSVKRVMDLHQAMTGEGFSVCAIHSSMEKSEREEAFYNFRSGSYRVLISSNVTARGIDIQQVSTVINFDIPSCCNTYLHRIGRSGRWGRKGCAINFVTKRDIFTMKKIENHFKINMTELPANYNSMV
jgi:translation initiation factor 4A